MELLLLVLELVYLRNEVGVKFVVFVVFFAQFVLLLDFFCQLGEGLLLIIIVVYIVFIKLFLVSAYVLSFGNFTYYMLV